MVTAAATYELATHQLPPEGAPLARNIPEDERARFRMEQIVEEAGQLAVGNAAEYNPDNREAGSIGYENLMEAICFAARGEETARRMVVSNARTHIIECLMKAGIIFETDIDVDSRGRLIQHRQLLEEVYRNALQWAASGPEMRERVRIETYNGFLAESWLRNHRFNHEKIVVISPYPTSPDLTDERARRIGFFPETRSCVIQTIGMKNGRLVQEVAFVAGAAQPGGRRYDLPAIQGLAAELGIVIDANSSVSVLGTPFAIASEISLLDVVKRYDYHAGGTFFGQQGEQQDYEAYLEHCRERMAGLEPMVQEVVDEMIMQANTLRHPTDATRMLHDIAQRHMVAAAAEDRSIDERVFGPEAVPYIQAARQAFEVDDWAAYNHALSRAHRTAITGSCPIEEQTRNEGTNQSTAREGELRSERTSDSVPSTIRCIKCRRFSSRDEIVRKDSWRCPKCAYEIDVCTGKVLHHSRQPEVARPEPPQLMRLPLMRSLLAAA